MGITLQVDGMTCQHCVANVKKSLEAVSGVEQATPDLETGQVVIEGDDLNIGQLTQAVIDAGYTVSQ